MIKKQIRVSDINKHPYYEWVSEKEYLESVNVIHQNKIYKCIESHASSDGFNFDLGLKNWVEIDEHFKWLSEVDYLEGDIIIHDSKIYKCDEPHLSNNIFNLDINKWVEINDHSRWKPEKEYLKGDIISHNNKIYKCDEPHSSASGFDLDLEKWEETVIYPEWMSNKEYFKDNEDGGDVIIYNNKIYKCTISHLSGDDFELGNWMEIDIYPEWKPDEEYVEGDKDGGDIIIYNNKIYKCTISHLSGDDFELGNWVETDIYPEWMSNKKYFKDNEDGGDVIIYNNKIYKCDVSHLSGDEFDLENWSRVIVSFDILLTTNINDIGVKEPYDGELNLEKWEEVSNIITYRGESRIDEFKRYGKTINDSDLYTKNPLMGEGGITKEIVKTKPKIDPFSKQYIYEYTFTDSNDNVTTYDDVGDGTSMITYETKGLNENNAINLPSFKNEELLSVIGKPKVEVDVFIDRGINNSFDKHIKIGEIKTLESLEKYGNGVFKIKE